MNYINKNNKTIKQLISMQKKVLLPLLLAGPVAMPALADINYDFPSVTDWNSTGILPEGFIKADTQIDGLVGTGYIFSSAYTNFPGGKYQLKFSSVSNVQIAISNTEITTANASTLEYEPVENNVFEFTVVEGMPFYIAVTSINPAQPIQFTGLQLVLDFDAKEAIDATSGALDELYKSIEQLGLEINEVNPDDKGVLFPEGDLLRDKRQEWLDLYPNREELKNLPIVFENGAPTKTAFELYKLLSQTNLSDAQLAEYYQLYGYDEDPIYPVKYIQKQQEIVDNLIKAIEEENGKYQNYLTNQTNFGKLETDYKTVQDQINELTIYLNKAQGLTEEEIAKYTTALEKVQSDAADWWAGVEVAYPQPIEGNTENSNTWRDSVIDFDTFEANLKAISDNVESLNQQITNADADYQVYYNVNFVLNPALKKAYNQLYGYLNDDVLDKAGVENYEDNYNAWAEKILAEALSNYNAAVELLIPEVKGAVKYNKEYFNGTDKEGTTLQKFVQETIDWLNSKYQTVPEYIKAENGLMSDALEDIADYTEEVSGLVKNTVVPDKFKPGWEKLVQEANDAIADFQKYLDGLYAQEPEFDDENGAYVPTINVEAPEYTADVQAIEDAIQALKNFIEKNKLADLNGVQDALKEAWDRIGDMPEGEWVQGKMKDTKDEIQKAIDSLDPTSDDFQTELGNVEKSIKDLELAAGALSGLVGNIDQYFEWISNFLITFNNEVAKKTFKEYTSTTYNQTFQNMIDYLAKFAENEDGTAVDPDNVYGQALAQWAVYRNDYDQVKSLEGDIVLQELEKFKGQIFGSSFLNTIANDILEFELGGTNINWNNVKALWAVGLRQLQAIDTPSDYPGYGDAMNTSDALAKQLEEIKGRIEAASTTASQPLYADLVKELNTNVTVFTTIDKELYNLIAQVVLFNNSVQNVIDNKKAYDDFQNQLATLSDWLQKLKQYNTEYTDEPAQETFADYIKDNLDPAYAALEKQIEDAYNGVTASSNKTALQKAVDDFDAQVLATYKWDKQNNQYHQSQVAEGISVGEYINGLISQIDDLLNGYSYEDEDGETVEVEGVAGTTVGTLLEGWKETLESLLTTSNPPLNWTSVNDLVYNYYGEGQSYGKDGANDEEIMGDYAALRQKAKEIADNLSGDAYHDAVVGANNTTTQSWEMEMSDLDDERLAGISLFNKYFSFPGLTNAGWRNFVENVYKTGSGESIQVSHQPLFTFYKQIEDLNNEFNTWLTEQNKANHVITQAEYQEWLDKAEAISNLIDAEVTSMVSDMNDAGNRYYAELNGDVDAQIKTAEDILKEQGIPTSPYLDDINEWDGQAHKDYAAASSATDALKQVGAMMNGIADLLDQCLQPSPYTGWDQAYQDWASQQWDAEYSEAQKTIQDYEQFIDSTACQDADADYRAEQMQQFESIVDKIEELNGTVKGVTEGLIDDFGNYSDQLDDLLKLLEKIKDNIQQNSDANVAEKAARDAWEKQLPAMNEALDNLNDYALSLAGAAVKNIGDEINVRLKENIESLANLVNKSPGKLASLNITGRYDNVMSEIEKGYQDVANAEFAYLMGQLYPMTQEAFNNANEFVSNKENADKLPAIPEGYETWTEYFDAMDALIEGYKADLGPAGTWGNEWTYDTRDTWRSESREKEKELSAIYVELSNIFNPEPGVVSTILDTLNKLADGVQSSLDSAKATLEGYEYISAEEKAALSQRYADIQTALEEEMGLWKGEGSWIVAREAFHKIALEFLAFDVDDVAADAEEAEIKAKDAADKKAENDARYGELSEQLQSLQDQLDSVKEEIEGYSDSVQEAYEQQLQDIQDMIDAAQKALDEANAEGSLTSTSDLENAKKIEEAITNAQLGATKMQAEEMLDLAKEARGKASDALKKRIVPEIYTELKPQYDQFNNQLNGLLDDVFTADYDELQNIIEQAQQLAEEFNSIAEQAQENTYYLGDVNDNPDGVVDVYDVQILINWIGEGMTYDELYALNPRQALAADITGDHELNIADVTTLIQWIINGQVEEINGLRVKSRTDIDDNSNAIYVQLVEDVNGVRTYAVNLMNETAFRGGQLDLITTGDARIKVITEAERTVNHEVISYHHDDNTSRVMIVSLNNNDILGNNGNVAYVTIEGDGDLVIDNVIFSDSDNRAHKLSKAATNGVNGILDTLKEYGEKIYDAAGRMYNKVQRGINIIRHKDGSVTKEIRK